MARTVLLLNPMGVDIEWAMTTLMKGTLVGVGDTVYKIPYTNQPGIANIDAGVTLLDNKLNSTAGPILVFGYSEGCQVADKWLSVHGPTTSVDPDLVEFLLIANANRKYGGFNFGHDVFNSVAWTQGKPADTPFTVVDFSRQYDGISDFPTAQPIQDALDSLVGVGSDLNLFNDAMQDMLTILGSGDYTTAVLNSLAGAVLIHNWYFDVSVADPVNVSLVEGNITWVWSPTYPVPLLGANAMFSDQGYRIKVERCYQRPVVLPSPDYSGGPSRWLRPAPITGWWPE